MKIKTLTTILCCLGIFCLLVWGLNTLTNNLATNLSSSALNISASIPKTGVSLKMGPASVPLELAPEVAKGAVQLLKDCETEGQKSRQEIASGSKGNFVSEAQKEMWRNHPLAKITGAQNLVWPRKPKKGGIP